MIEEHRTVFIKGRRIVLRPIVRADVAKLLKWANSPQTRQYLPVYFPLMEKDKEDWIDKLVFRRPHDVVLAIDTVVGEFVGTIELHSIEWRDRVAMSGTVIGESSYLGKGYAHEAKMLLLDYAFNVINLRKVCANVVATNKNSYRHNLRCGYKEEGRLRRQRFVDGGYRDEILMAVFREDFKKVWKKHKKQILPETHG